MESSELLTVHLKPYELSYVLKRFEKHLFDYLFETSTALFYEIKYKNILGFKIPYKSRPVSKDIAYKLYSQLGMKKILSELKDPTLYTIYSNYHLIYTLDKSPLISVIVKDLKILMNIAQLTSEDISKLADYYYVSGN